MKNIYFLIFIIFAIVLVLLFYYFRLVDLRYSEKEIFEIRSTREDIHTVLEDGVWRIEHPNFIPQFGGDLQNTWVYPGDGLRGIRIIDSRISHERNLVYKIRHRGLICSSPAVYDRIIYFGANDGHFYAIDIDSWEEKWVVRTGRASQRKRGMHVTTGSCPPAPAMFSSPVIYDGVAYFGTAYGYAYALDIKDGNIIWKAEIPELHLANPKIYKDYLYIGSKDRHLYKLDAKTGNMVWKYKTQGEIITTPAIYEDRLFINCQERYLYAIDTEGNLCWKIDLGVPTRNSPVIYDGIVFLDSYYFFYAINVNTGREIWIAGPYKNISQCAASKGRVYFTGIDEQDSSYNYLNFYSFNVRNGKLEWKSQMRSYDKKIAAYRETRITERWDSGVSGHQLIISGNMVHSIAISNSWFKYDGKYKRSRGTIYGYPHSDPNFKHDYSFTVDNLHSPVAIYDEVIYYGAEIYAEDGCYTGLYAMQSMQDEFRWQPPHPGDWSISYPLMSENVIVLYDLIIKEKDIIQKEEDPYLDTNLYTSEFHIMAYDIQSKEEIFSGTIHTEETGPLTILNRSSATHSDKLFIEACVLRKIEREEIPSESIRISIITPSIMRKYFERQLISSAYYAFDIQTGKLIWKYEIGQKILNTPPLVYEDNIYIGSYYILDDLFDMPNNLKGSYNIFISLDSEDGKEIWKVEIIGTVLSKPLIHNDILYFGTDKGFIYAIDRFEGEILWKFHINGGISTTPALYNDIIFIGSWNWNIYAIDAQTGKGKWKYRTRGEVRGELFAHEDQLYFLSRISQKDPFSRALKGIERFIFLQSVNIRTGIEEWNYRRFHCFDNSSLNLLHSDKIYMLSTHYVTDRFYSSLKAIDLKTGTPIWKKKTEEDYKKFNFSDSFFKFFKDRIFVMSRIKRENLINYLLAMSRIKREDFIMIIDANTGEIMQTYMLIDMKLHSGLKFLIDLIADWIYSQATKHQTVRTG